MYVTKSDTLREWSDNPTQSTPDSSLMGNDAAHERGDAHAV